MWRSVLISAAVFVWAILGANRAYKENENALAIGWCFVGTIAAFLGLVMFLIEVFP